MSSLGNALALQILRIIKFQSPFKLHGKRHLPNLSSSSIENNLCIRLKVITKNSKMKKEDNSVPALKEITIMKIPKTMQSHSPKSTHSATLLKWQYLL